MISAVFRIAGASVVCALASCGGSSDVPSQGNEGGGGTTSHVDTLYSIDSRDGWVDNQGNASTSTVPLVGDYTSSNVIAYYRQVFSFSLAGIPQTAQVSSAKLILNQGQVRGDPYGKFGGVKVYHIALGNPPTLVDYLSAPLAGSPGPLTISETSTLGTRELLITNWVFADIGAGRIRSEFRLQFSGADGNRDGINDTAYFTDATSICCPGATPPRLVVTWF